MNNAHKVHKAHKANNMLAIQRTKFSNQRTYLSYMRTGLAIASVAGVFKQMWIALFGVIMIIGSVTQYILINHKLNHSEDLNSPILDMFPLFYVILSLGTLYLQWKK